MSSPNAMLRAAKAMPGAARYTPAPQGSNQRAGNSLGQYSPLVAQLNSDQSYGSIYPSSFLPRPSQIFTEGAFGPFSPILPTPVDQPPEGAQRPEPRVREIEPGWNLPTQPGSEGLKLVPFSTLRSLAELYSVARVCVQLRKSEIQSLDWDIIPSHAAAKAYHGDRPAMKDFAERRAKLVKFFRHPDPNYFSFGTWLGALLEEVFVYDALSILIRPKWGRGMGKGVLGTDLDSLMLLAGSTVRPLLDLHGATPRPPAPAYQQFLFGLPRSDYMDIITQRDLEQAGLTEEDIKGEYRGDQLLYMPMNPRAWTPYGFPPVERALIPIMSGLQKQAYQLAWFREGCYDRNTEILTNNGWKLFSELTDNDKVATRSSEGKFEWQLPQRRQRFRHDGPMVEFKNKSMDLLVTPNHRMLVKRPDYYINKHPKCTGQEWHIREAQFFVDNPTSWFEVPVSSTWDAQGPDEFVIPARTGRQNIFKMPMEDYCRFLGLFIAEGWVQDRSLEGTGRREVNVWVSQSPKSRHLESIKEILDSTGLKWDYLPDSRKFRTVSASLGRWLKDGTGHLAWNKHIPQGFKDLPVNCLEALLDGLLMGDGERVPDGWGRRYTSTSPQLADDVQELFQKTGHDAWVKQRTQAENGVLPGDRRAGTDRRPIYVVYERVQKAHGLPKPRLTDYHGDVYCVTVPNSIVYVRRNGRALWCGNTVPEVYVSPGDVNMTPNQLRELQDALNAFAGDPAWKHKIIVLPPGSKTEPMKSKEIADQFDEIVMSQVAMAFDVNPLEIGLLPKVSTVASPFAAREMSQASRSVHDRVSTKPTLKFLADIFDNIMHRVLGQDDMKFTFEGLQEESEANQMTQMLSQQVQFGIRSVDEARDELELEPWGLPETSGPVFFGPQGPIPFGQVSIDESGQATGVESQTSAATEGAAQNETLNHVNPNANTGQQPGQGNDLGPELTPAHMAAQAFMNQPSARPGGGTPKDNAKFAKTLMGNVMRAEVLAKQDRARISELETLARHLKNGRDPDSWEVKTIPRYAPALLQVEIQDGVSRSEAVDKIAKIIMGDSDYEWSYNIPQAA